MQHQHQPQKAHSFTVVVIADHFHRLLILHNDYSQTEMLRNVKGYSRHKTNNTPKTRWIKQQPAAKARRFS